MFLLGFLVFLSSLSHFSYSHNCIISQNDCSDGNLSSKILQHPVLSGVYISIKTTQKYHLSRLPLLLHTWLQTVPSENVYIVTDAKDNFMDMISHLGYNVFHSDCPKKHTNNALACKCGDEFKLYYEQAESGNNFRWYCHFDDDMYLNAIQLEAFLSTLDERDKYYIGRWSVGRNTKIKPFIRNKFYLKQQKREDFFFATGAAYCISRSLMTEMESYVRGERLIDTAKSIGTPDDMAIGFVVEALLGYDLTDVKEMNSHLNALNKISPNSLLKQITISYSGVTDNDRAIRRIKLPNGLFNEDEDPTRFYSYHCLVYPDTVWCHSPGHYIPQLNIS